MEIVFVNKREHFLKSIYEIRLKTNMYDPYAYRFKFSFTFEEMASFIEPDLLENGKVLTFVLSNIVEGFEED